MEYKVSPRTQKKKCIISIIIAGQKAEMRVFLAVLANVGLITRSPLVCLLNLRLHVKAEDECLGWRWNYTRWHFPTEPKSFQEDDKFLNNDALPKLDKYIHK